MNDHLVADPASGLLMQAGTGRGLEPAGFLPRPPRANGQR
jgi:hypothetical protein